MVIKYGDFTRKSEGSVGFLNIIFRTKHYYYTKILFVSNGGVLGDWTNDEFCTRGHYAIGYKMNRGRDRCGDTASSGQQNWGDWTGEALCPANTFLTSFSLQVQKYNFLFF
ncbi:unnamed protein product [Mytilus coruscus]|uniref:Uncharacterized protein n=1 Tax=Mytilus coruscus TaxID=42192 RepID=A0A6J8C4A0_MYTCO|nr:unnamed protein product [Mytilus coruscus]